MATKGEVLKEYTIKINTEIEGAKKEVAGLRTALKGKLGDNIGTEIEASMEAAEASLKSLSDTVDKRIREMNSSLRGLKLDKLQSDMKELSDSVKESVSVVKQQVDLLTTAFNSSDPARFEQFVAKITTPLADLTAAVKEATVEIKNLGDIKLGTVDTSSLDKAKEKVTRSKKVIQKELTEAVQSVAPIELSFSGKNRKGLQAELALWQNLIALYKEAADAGINANKVLSDFGAPGGLDEIKSYVKEARAKLAPKKQEPIDLNVRLKATFDADKDLDTKSVEDYIEKVKTQLIKKVQDAVSDEPIKLRFGWDVETDDSTKTTTQGKDILQDADKVLYKTLKIRMEGDESRLKANLDNIIEKVNSEIQGDPRFAIKVDILPNEIARGTILRKIQELGNVPTGTVNAGGKVTGEVTLASTEGLATENTLQQIRDLIAHNNDGPNKPGAPTASARETAKAQDKNWRAAYSKVDAYRERGAREYVSLKTFGRTIEDEVYSLAKTTLDLQKKFRFFVGMESDLKDTSNKIKKNGGVKNSKLYGAKIKTANGQEFSTYARYSERFKGREVSLAEWQEYLNGLEEQQLQDLVAQMKKTARKRREDSRKNLIKNGIEYKYNKDTKEWDQLASEASFNGAKTKEEAVEQLRKQHRAVVKGYEEEAAVQERYLENLRERKSIAEELVKAVDAGSDLETDELKVKQGRLLELTRTFKGDTEEEVTQNASKFESLIKEQRDLIGKGVKTEDDAKRIGDIFNEMALCFSDVTDVISTARSMLESVTEDGESRIDAQIREAEVEFNKRVKIAKKASNEYFTRSKIVNPDTEAGLYDIARTAREHKSGRKEPAGFFSEASLKPFKNSVDAMMKYLDSAEEYQKDLNKIQERTERINELERLNKYVPSGDGGRGSYRSGLTRMEKSALSRWRKERKEALLRTSTYEKFNDKELTKDDVIAKLRDTAKRGITIGNTNLTGAEKENYEKVYSKFIGAGSDMEEIILKMTEDEFDEFKSAVTAAKTQLGDNNKEAIGKKVQDYEEHMLKKLQADFDFALKTLRDDEASPADKLAAVDSIKDLQEELDYFKDPNAYVKNNISVDEAVKNFEVADREFSELLGKLQIFNAPDVSVFYKNLDDAIELANRLGIELSQSFEEMPEEYKKAFQNILSRGVDKLDKVVVNTATGEKTVFKGLNVDFMTSGSIQEAQDKYTAAYEEYQERVLGGLENNIKNLYYSLENRLYAARKEKDAAYNRGDLSAVTNVNGKLVPKLAYERHQLAVESFAGSQNGADKMVLNLAAKMPEYEAKRAAAAEEAAQKAKEANAQEQATTKSIQDQIAEKEALIAAEKEEIELLRNRQSIIDQTEESQSAYIASLKDGSGESDYASLQRQRDLLRQELLAYQEDQEEALKAIPSLPAPKSNKGLKSKTVQADRANYYKNRENEIINNTQPLINEVQSELDNVVNKIIEEENQYIIDLFSSADFRKAYYAGKDISSYTQNDRGLDFDSIVSRIVGSFDEDALFEVVEDGIVSESEAAMRSSLYLMTKPGSKLKNQKLKNIVSKAGGFLEYRGVETVDKREEAANIKSREANIKSLEQDIDSLKKTAAFEKDRETIVSKFGQDALQSAERIDALIAAINVLRKASEDVAALDSAIKADEKKEWPKNPSPEYTQNRTSNLERMKRALDEQRLIAERNQPNLLAMQQALVNEQEHAKRLGLVVSKKTGRAYSSNYAKRIGNVGLPIGNNESKYLTAEEQAGMNAMRKGVAEVTNRQAEEEKKLNEEIDRLRWEGVDAQIEGNKVAKARSVMTEKEISDLKEASKYAGMTQEQADAAHELREYNKKLKGKKPSGSQLWRQAYLQEVAQRTGLTISDKGNAYLKGFDTDEWMKNPFAYKGNSYTDRIFAEYKPKEYQKAVDSGLALEVTQKSVLNAINSLKKEGIPTRDEKTTPKGGKSSSPASKDEKKSRKPQAEVPQEIKDAQKVFKDKAYRSFADFDDAAKEAAKTAILSGRNLYINGGKRKPENKGLYGIDGRIANAKTGFTDVTKDIAKQLGIDLPDLDALRKAAEQKAVETKASAKAVVIEANATETLAEQMIAAAKAKEDFAKANGLVLDTAAESAPKVEEEAKAVEELNEELQKMTRVNWEDLTPEAQKKITDEFGEDVDVYASKGTSDYRVVGRRKTGSVNEKGELTRATAKIVNRLTESKAAEKAAEQEAKKDSKSEYSSRLDEKLKRYEDLLGRKAKGDESFNKEIALLEARILDNIDELANSEYHDENLEFNVMERFGAIQKSFGRNKDNFKYKQQQKAEAEAQREANKAAERKAREERQAQEKAQREADNAAKKAQDEADKKAADKKKADEKEASKNDAETLKKFQEDATAHNKDAAASYKELSKSADEYIKLVDRSQASDFSDDERVRLDSLEEKWALASAAKRLYYLADLEKQGSLTQEQADELRQLRDFWSEATQEQRLYLIAADGTESSIKAVRDAMDSIDSANDKALERYFSSAREEAQKLLNVLDGIASGNYTDAFKAQAKALRDSIFKIDESGSKTGFMTMLDSDAPFDQVMAQREMLRRQGANIRAGMGDAGNRAAKSVSINSLLSSAERTRKTYLGMPTDLLSQYDAIIERLKWMQGQEFGVVSVEEVSKEAAALKGLDAQLEASGRKTAGVFGTVTNRLTDMNAKFIAQYFSIQDWIRYMRTAVTTVIELDTALTELRKVSSETDERLAQSMRNSARTATMLGSTITDVVNATADWARLGYNVDQAEELARVSILYKNVGDNIDIDTASSSLISTMKGYQLEADQAESIVDKFNEIGNNFAINSAEIGEALKRSAASFNASGTSLDKSIALVTAANTVAQNAESVGGLMRPPI